MSQDPSTINYLLAYKKRVEKKMRLFFDDLAEFEDILSISSEAELALERLKEFNFRPAKRLRAALAIHSYQAYGGNFKGSIDLAAVAIELIQDSFLMIDDVMDQSDIRRSQPCTHMLYRNQLKKILPSYSHMGDMLAINVGVLANFLAFEALNRIKQEKPKNIEKARQVFTINSARTGFGQIQDMHNNKYQLQSEEQIILILTNKSSYYTFVSPLQIGAALAGANQKQLEQLKKYGIPAGLAFQINDDIIGLFGNERETGKSNENDIREGKITLLVRYAIDNTSNRDRAFLLDVLGDRSVAKEKIEQFRQIIRNSGSLDYARKAMDGYCRKAESTIDGLAISEEDKSILFGILKYITRGGHNE